MYTKILLRNRIRSVFLIVALLGTIGYNFILLTFDNVNLYITPINAFIYQEQLAYYLFLIMLFLSFDYYREFKDAKVFERVTGSSELFKCSFSLLTRMLYVVTAYSTIIWTFMVSFWNKSEVLNKHTLYYLTKNVLLYFFSTGILASIISMCISLYMSTMWGYVSLFILALVLGPLSDYSMQILSSFFRRGTVLIYYFSIFPSTSDAVNPFVAITANPTTLAKTLMWISIFLLLIIVKLKFTNKLFVGIIVLICSISTIVTIKKDYSYNNATPIISMNSSRYNNDYYANHPSVYNEDAAFRIESYDMQLEVTSQLKANVLITLESNELSEYKFTLHHGYEVDSITDGEGKSLKYNRFDDYINISSSVPINKIRIIYKGGNPEFYSSYDQVFLPGFFPYYPIAGYKPIIDLNKNKYADNSYSYHVKYDIRINAYSKIFSNLDSYGYNSFSGYSRCPTIICGLIEESDINGVSSINQYIAKETSNKALYMDFFIDYVTNAMKAEGIKKILFLPVTGHIYPTIIDDNSIITNNMWFTLAYNYDANRDFSKMAYDNDVSEQLRIERFKWTYYLNEIGNMNDYYVYYSFYQRFMLDNSDESEENFESFFKDNIGLNEWNKLIEGRER